MCQQPLRHLHARCSCLSRRAQMAPAGVCAGAPLRLDSRHLHAPCSPAALQTGMSARAAHPLVDDAEEVHNARRPQRAVLLLTGRAVEVCLRAHVRSQEACIPNSSLAQHSAHPWCWLASRNSRVHVPYWQPGKDRAGSQTWVQHICHACFSEVLRAPLSYCRESM